MPAAAALFPPEWEGLPAPRFAVHPRPGPRLVAIEGPNGAGKSTLCAALGAALSLPVCLGTDEAWFSEPFKVRMIRDADWHASALFFLSGCFEQTRLCRSRPEPIILLDRCLWSTLAVQAATAPARLAQLVGVLTPLAGLVQPPDLTIVLEASFSTCTRRIAHKTGAARELDNLTAEPAFHARERAFYQWLSRCQPGIVFLDANQDDVASTTAAAATLIRRALSC